MNTYNLKAIELLDSDWYFYNVEHVNIHPTIKQVLSNLELDDSISVRLENLSQDEEEFKVVFKTDIETNLKTPVTIEVAYIAEKYYNFIDTRLEVLTKKTKLRRKSKNYPDGEFVSDKDIQTFVEKVRELKNNAYQLTRKKLIETKVNENVNEFLKDETNKENYNKVVNYLSMSNEDKRNFLINAMIKEGYEEVASNEENYAVDGFMTKRSNGSRWQVFTVYSYDFVNDTIKIQSGSNDD